MSSHPLATLFIERLATNLQRQSITKPSKWAQTYRVMKTGPWQFSRYPWLREMHDSQAPVNIGKKAAQMGYTETVLNITFYKIDVLGTDVLYVLPNRSPDASDFSASRFDPALELSPHLAKLFSNVKNVGHKRAGSANLYVRGSQSRAGLKSIPVETVILDEIEEFNVESIPLALERTSGQLNKNAWLISTPSIEDKGIDVHFKKSTQESFFFPCPLCGRAITFSWPESVVIVAENLSQTELINQTRYICSACKGTLVDNETKHKKFLEAGYWVPAITGNNDIRGFYINQLFSPTISPREFASQYLKSLNDPTEEQEFYNSKLGITHAVKGARLSETDIRNTIKSYSVGPKQGIVTLGVDVGTYLHYEIDLWHLPPTFKTRDINYEAVPQILAMDKCTDFEELDRILHEYHVRFCIIDAQPERRKAREFANRFQGRVKLCFYGRGITGKQINVHSDEPLITVDRTSWLDLSLNRFRGTDRISLPNNATLLQEYIDHLRVLVRRYKKDKDGNPTAEYVSGEKPDHFAHARNYAEIALPFAVSMSQNYNLSVPL